MVSTVQEVLNKVLQSPQMREVQAGIENDRLAKRRELAEKIKIARDKQLADQPKHQAAADKAVEKATAAHEAWKAAQREAAQAVEKAANRSAKGIISRLEGEMRGSADSEVIDAFLNKVDEQIDRFSSGSFSNPRTTKTNIFGNEEELSPGNAREVNLCVTQLREVHREAREVVPLESLTRDELDARFSKLWDSVEFPG